MPLRLFLLKLFRHSALAYLCWYALILVSEILVPGAVSPYVDLALGGLVAVLATVMGICLDGRTKYD